MASSKELDALDRQIAALQAQIDTLSARKSELVRANTYVDTLRPTGIPATWLPIFDILAATTPAGTPNYNVTGWYDPQKWGTDCNVIGKQT
jgi:hypothetical protein